MFDSALCAALMREAQACPDAFRVTRVRGVPCLIFRGTAGFDDVKTDARFAFAALREARTSGRVHAGFLDAYRRLRIPPLRRPIVFGYSLGGALAVLHAAHRPVRAVYIVGAPRVGDRAFAEAYARLAHPTFAVENVRDVVPYLPPGYERVGSRVPFEFGGTLAGRHSLDEYLNFVTE